MSRGPSKKESQDEPESDIMEDNKP